MANSSSSSKSAAKVTVLGKRKLGDGLGRHKETSDEKTTKGLVDSLQQNSDQANLISAKEAVVTKKTLFITNLSPYTRLPDIIAFFENVAQVVRVRLTVTSKCVHRCYGFVEFASAKEAKKALEKKNGEFLFGQEIFLYVAKKTPYAPRTQYYLDHNVCFKHYFGRADEAVEGLDETPEGVLFVANLSPQTKILHIKEFFNSVGQVVSVRLVVNHERKHVGYGFVEFASANEAKKALENKNGEYFHGHKIFLDVARNAPPRPQFKLAEKLCYEDYLRRQNLVREEDETVEGFDEAIAVGEKTVFVTGLSSQAEIPDIIDFFKCVGEVVHVRLIVDNTGEHVGDGFIEFASADEAKKALERRMVDISLVVRSFLMWLRNLHTLHDPNHKVWYEDYLRRENLLIEEDEAMEGLDEIPDFVEEVAARKKTIFIYDIPSKTSIPKIIRFFKDVGRVVRLRLNVDQEGAHVGCGFVEFASVDEAEEALVKKNGREYSLDVVEIPPYPLRPKYNLAEKLWLKVEGFLIKEEEEEEEEEEEVEVVEEEEEEEDDDDDLETKPNLEKQEVPWMDGFCGKKIIFSYDD